MSLRLAATFLLAASLACSCMAFRTVDVNVDPNLPTAVDVTRAGSSAEAIRVSWIASGGNSVLSRVCDFAFTCQSASTLYAGETSTSGKGSFAVAHRSDAATPPSVFVTDDVAQSWGSARHVGFFEVGTSPIKAAIRASTDLSRLKVRALTLDDDSVLVVAARSGSSGNDMNILRCIDRSCSVNETSYILANSTQSSPMTMLQLVKAADGNPMIVAQGSGSGCTHPQAFLFFIYCGDKSCTPALQRWTRVASGPCAVTTANIRPMTVAVPPGQHPVVLYYDPRTGSIGSYYFLYCTSVDCATYTEELVSGYDSSYGMMVFPTHTGGVIFAGTSSISFGVVVKYCDPTRLGSCNSASTTIAAPTTMRGASFFWHAGGVASVNPPKTFYVFPLSTTNAITIVDTTDEVNAAQPPASPPVQAPLSPPVQAPVDAPVQSPIDAPVQAPESAPAASPVSTPVSAPLATPVAVPVDGVPVSAPQMPVQPMAAPQAVAETPTAAPASISVPQAAPQSSSASPIASTAPTGASAPTMRPSSAPSSSPIGSAPTVAVTSLFGLFLISIVSVLIISLI